MEFSTLPSHSQWIAFNPLELQELMKLSSTGIHHDDRAHMITLEMFTKGFCELGFDLTPDREADEEHKSTSSRKCAH